MKKQLTELMDKYGSDKGTIIDAGHSFSEFYDQYFKHYEYPVILEIGIQHGGDIKAINEFYGGKCNIYGIDIDESCRDLENKLSNFKFYNVNQDDRQSLVVFKNEMLKHATMFDIILDDGSHKWFDQMLTLSMLHGLLKQDGIYILEDLHTSLVEAFNPWAIHGTNFSNSPLHSLIHRKACDSCYMPQNESAALFSSIKTVTIFENYDNNSNVQSAPSVTSVITFK